MAMDTAEIRYRPLPLILGTVFFAACSAWLLFGPETGGTVGQALGGRGSLTLLSAMAAGCGLAATCFFAFYTARMAFGWPALEVDEREIRVHILPFRKFPLSEVDDVRIEGANLLIALNGRKDRKIRLAMLAPCEASIVNIRASLLKARGQDRAGTRAV